MKALIKPNIKKSISRYTEEDFGSTFREDLRGALSRVILVSPFIRHKRLKFWLPEIEAAIKRGVTICVYLQDPVWTDEEEVLLEQLPQQSIEEFNSLVKKLDSKGVHVIVRKRIHQKIAIIDGEIVWEGSLNILSYTGNTEEQMLRQECTEAADWMLNRHRLHCPRCKTDLTHVEWVGKQFAKCRDALGLNQHQLAGELGITQTTISKIERGKWNLKLDILIEYSNIMDFDIGFTTKTLASASSIELVLPKNPQLTARAKVGWQLAFHRKQRRYTQDKTVEGLGLSRTDLSRIEKGTRNFAVGDLCLVADSLGLALVLVPRNSMTIVTA